MCQNDLSWLVYCPKTKLSAVKGEEVKSCSFTDSSDLVDGHGAEDWYVYRIIDGYQRLYERRQGGILMLGRDKGMTLNRKEKLESARCFHPSIKQRFKMLQMIKSKSDEVA